MSAVFLGLGFCTYNLLQDFEDHDFEPAKGQERAHLDPLILLNDQGEVAGSKLPLRFLHCEVLSTFMYEFFIILCSHFLTKEFNLYFFTYIGYFCEILEKGTTNQP